MALAASGYAALPDRGVVAIGAVAAATTSTWLLQHDAGVTLLEAYTLPLALMLGALGALRWRRERGAPSWAVAGPALSVALLPSAWMSLGEDSGVRALLVLVVAAVVTTLGAWLRWQSPLTTGAAAVALVLLGRGAPVVAQVPTWITLTLVGAALVVVGATYEQRRAELTHAGRWVAALR